MHIQPIRFHFNKLNSASDFMPTPVRYNALRDVEFDIIANEIKAKSLKTPLGLLRLKKSLDDFVKNTNNE